MVGFLDLVLEDRRQNRPETGYNVYGLDDWALPGERIYVIEHFEDRREAEAFQREQGPDTIIIAWTEQWDTE